MGLNDIERQVMDSIHSIIADAIDHEPAIEDKVVQALGESSAPGEIAAAVGSLVSVLLKHFHATAAAVPASPEPAADVPVAPAEDQAA